jgi:hypothetical protein
MSASNEWFEYHLTPNGWIEGSEKIDFAGIKEKKVPDDKVLTLRFHEYMSSTFSPVDKWYEETYRHGEDGLVEDLTKKFGELPGSYKETEYNKR